MPYAYENRTQDETGTAGVPVLCIGYAAEIVDERCRHLAASGYDVHAARTREQATTLLRERQFAGVVIGNAVPEPDRLDFIQMARALNPQAIVVLLYRDSIRRAEAAQAVISAENGPSSLVSALRELLRT